jgi:hypothetical protein
MGVISASVSGPAISAAAALVGALVGAGATVWAGSAEAHRRAKSEAEASRRRARVGARLLWADLEWAQRRVAQAQREGRFWSADAEPWPEQTWLSYRESLAEALDDQWPAVRVALRSLRVQAVRSSDARRAADEPRPGLSKSDRAQLRYTAHALKAGLTALESLEPREQRSVRHAEAEPAGDVDSEPRPPRLEDTDSESEDQRPLS